MTNRNKPPYVAGRTLKVIPLPAHLDPNDLLDPNEIDDAGKHALENEPQAVAVRYVPRTRKVTIKLKSGATYTFPVDKCQGLVSQRDEDLAQIEIMGLGMNLRWPRLDQDYSVAGLLAGRFGSRKWMADEQTAAAVLGSKGGRSRSTVKVAASRRNIAKATAARTARSAEAARVNGAKGGRPRKSKG